MGKLKEMMYGKEYADKFKVFDEAVTKILLDNKNILPGDASIYSLEENPKANYVKIVFDEGVSMSIQKQIKEAFDNAFENKD